METPSGTSMAWPLMVTVAFLASWANWSAAWASGGAAEGAAAAADADVVRTRSCVPKRPEAVINSAIGAMKVAFHAAKEREARCRKDLVSIRILLDLNLRWEEPCAALRAYQ